MSDAVAALRGPSGARQVPPVAWATQSGDRVVLAVGIEFRAQPADKDFDDIAVTFFVFGVEMLRQLAFGDDLAGVRQQIFEHAELITDRKSTRLNSSH